MATTRAGWPVLKKNASWMGRWRLSHCSSETWKSGSARTCCGTRRKRDSRPPSNRIAQARQQQRSRRFDGSTRCSWSSLIGLRAHLALGPDASRACKPPQRCQRRFDGSGCRHQDRPTRCGSSTLVRVCPLPLASVSCPIETNPGGSGVRPSTTMDETSGAAATMASSIVVFEGCRGTWAAVAASLHLQADDSF